MCALCRISGHELLDVNQLYLQVFGAHPEEMTTSPSNTRRDASSTRRTDGPPPLFSDSEDDLLDINI